MRLIVWGYLLNSLQDASKNPDCLNKARREQKILTKHTFDMQGNIFCEQRSIVTKRGKQVDRIAVARKCGFLEMPYNLTAKDLLPG